MKNALPNLAALLFKSGKLTKNLPGFKDLDRWVGYEGKLILINHPEFEEYKTFGLIEDLTIDDKLVRIQNVTLGEFIFLDSMHAKSGGDTFIKYENLNATKVTKDSGTLRKNRVDKGTNLLGLDTSSPR
jgi:hypothetical protein